MYTYFEGNHFYRVVQEWIFKGPRFFLLLQNQKGWDCRIIKFQKSVGGAKPNQLTCQNVYFWRYSEFPRTNISPLPRKLVYNSSSHWPEHQLGPKGHVHLCGRDICHAKLFDDLTNMQNNFSFRKLINPPGWFPWWFYWWRGLSMC